MDVHSCHATPAELGVVQGVLHPPVFWIYTWISFGILRLIQLAVYVCMYVHSALLKYMI